MRYINFSHIIPKLELRDQVKAPSMLESGGLNFITFLVLSKCHCSAREFILDVQTTESHKGWTNHCSRESVFFLFEMRQKQNEICNKNQVFDCIFEGNLLLLVKRFSLFFVQIIKMLLLSSRRKREKRRITIDVGFCHQIIGYKYVLYIYVHDYFVLNLLHRFVFVFADLPRLWRIRTLTRKQTKRIEMWKTCI